MSNNTGKSPHYFYKYIYFENNRWTIHYDLENYASPSPSYTGWDGSYTETTFGHFVGSVRFEGEVGKTRLNLYSETDRKNLATSYETNHPSVTVSFKSILLVGHEDVELYLLPNYAGFSYCLKATISPITLVDDTSAIGLEPGDVKSFRFGCSPTAAELSNV
jgi:hypothetical protein